MTLTADASGGARRAHAQAPGRGQFAAKTVVPSLPVDYVSRPRLDERLQDALQRRLTCLVAGPGFGKSTLVGAWAAAHDCAWYTLDDADSSLTFFARGLSEALRRRLPAPAAEVDIAFRGSPASTADEKARAEAIASALCQSLHGVLARPLVLVLDDVQEIAVGSPAARLIGAICRQAPEHLHVVLASREPPPFATARLRGRGQVLELDASVLAFTADEVAALVAATLAADAAGALLQRLVDLTGGWPAAVRLSVEALRAFPPEDRAAELERLTRPQGPLLSYLAEEVCGHEPPRVRELLRKVAPLVRFTVELCETLGCARADQTVAELATRGLFAQRQDEWYSLHRLVREFVQHAWRLPASDERDVQRRAAAWFEANEQPREALTSYAAAGDSAEVARLLAARGAELIAGGDAEAVLWFADALPAGLRSESVELVAGEAHAARGDLERALACFACSASGPEPPAALAWRMIDTYLGQDALDEARSVYERCPIASAENADDARVLASASRVEWRLGRIDAARDLSERALAAALACRDDRALAAAHTAAASVAHAGGDASSRDRHRRAALEAAESARDVLQLMRVRNNIGSDLLEESSYVQAIAELDRAAQLAELAGSPSGLAIALMNRGLANYGLGRLGEAGVDYRAALEQYRRTGTAEAAYALVGLGDVYRERGDTELARVAYEEGLALAERSGDLQALVPASYQLAKVLVDDDPERATALAEAAVSHGWPDLPWALNAAGWIALARGRRDDAVRAARDAATAARGRRDRFGLAEALELRGIIERDPAQLREALAIWTEIGNELRAAGVEVALARLTEDANGSGRPDDAERRLRTLGVRLSPTGPAGLLREVARRGAAPVSIQTLGRFRVRRTGTLVGPRDWQSKKARALLKILVSRRGRPTPREVLMEALWPEDDPRVVANRLSVALATIRAVLDPDRVFAADHFVAADKDTLALDLTHVGVDVEEFFRRAEEGLALRRAGPPDEAARMLEAAEHAYAGEFLEEDAYEDWAIPLREEARNLYIAVARALAEDANAAGDHDAAVRYLLRVLERDAYDERGHLALVSTLLASERHGEARRAYGRYVAQMEEIGVEPAPLPRP